MNAEDWMQKTNALQLQISECASGENEDAYWVSLFFSSPDTDHDVLHIECGRIFDPYPGFQGPFIERHGQGEGDYELAHSIVVSADLVVVMFTALGIKELSFPPELRFELPVELKGARDFLRTLQLMSETPNGAFFRVSHDSNITKQTT